MLQGSLLIKAFLKASHNSEQFFSLQLSKQIAELVCFYFFSKAEQESDLFPISFNPQSKSLTRLRQKICNQGIACISFFSSLLQHLSKETMKK